MKTLDEVIKALELCTSPVLEDGCIHGCPYSDLTNECACDYNAIPQMQKDALHYLKEYREHLKWQAYEEYCLAEEKKKIKQAYEQGYAQAKHDDEVSRSWEESYRQSQMPWNHYTEMGG